MSSGLVQRKKGLVAFSKPMVKGTVGGYACIASCRVFSMRRWISGFVGSQSEAKGRLSAVYS